MECNYNPCSSIFNPKGNQRYHSPECSKQARKQKERLRKRKKRHGQYQKKIEQQVTRRSIENTKEPVRKSKNSTKYFYKCDYCNNSVKRVPRLLNVYCSSQCCTQAYNKRKRLKRFSDQKANKVHSNNASSLSKKDTKEPNLEKNAWKPHFPNSP